VATALISLGSNLGDRAATLTSALAALEATPDVYVVQASRFYETTPVGGPGFQEPFLNGAALLETKLEPEALLDVLQRVENEHGRMREEHWGPRTLDLDLLTYEDLVLHTPRLTLPHPRLSYRKFVLEGVVEIAPQLRHPLLARRYAELLDHLDAARNYVAFVGPNGIGGVDFRSQFAAEAADCGGAKLAEATPRDVPAFAELIASPPSPTSVVPIKFIRARITAIQESLVEAGEKWIVDDGWLLAEIGELAQRIGDDDGKLFDAASISEGEDLLHITPKLVAVLRTRSETPATAVDVLQRLLPEVPLPPIIDLEISDRERALTEFAAALDAAR
jgi:2-amino-4-hydroxy-6-hydroxymethyldihydropteridine diphosphokinase